MKIMKKLIITLLFCASAFSVFVRYGYTQTHPKKQEMFSRKINGVALEKEKIIGELECPSQTQYIKYVNKEVDSYNDGLYWGGDDRFEGQIEEYCVKDGKRHGPYRKWGPNGELEEQGHFEEGEKHGVWDTVIPSQIQQRTYNHGKKIKSEVFGLPKKFIIDFDSCIPHGKGIHGLGVYEMRGPAGQDCQMTIVQNLDGHCIDAVYECLVPRSEGKITLEQSIGALGVVYEFDAIKKHCIENEADDRIGPIFYEIKIEKE